MQEYRLKTTVSGRYHLQLPSNSAPAPLLAGFHGYGQKSEDELALLSAIPGSEKWLCCSIEALHPIYTPKGDEGASWMTRCDRELRIEENVRYVDSVIGQVRRSHSVSEVLCFHGFSQGAGMASRAALIGRYPASGLMLLGGDIPPELPVTGRLQRVHIGRGSRDRLYLEERYRRDLLRLEEGGVTFTACSFTGSHGANEEYFASAGEFLGSL